MLNRILEHFRPSAKVKVVSAPSRSSQQQIGKKSASVLTCLAVGATAGVGAIATNIAPSSPMVEEAHAASATLTHNGRCYYHSSSYCGKGRPYYTSWFQVENHVGYCVQPRNHTPNFGAYTKNYYNNAAMAAALYFGYGGPGFNYAVANGWYPSRNCDGNAMTASDYYVATHVIVSYLYGSDALYGTCSRYRNWANSNLLGWVLTNLRNNTWQLPTGFQNKVWVMYTGWNVQDIISFDYMNAGGIRINKTEGSTGKPLAGIKFDVHYSDRAGHVGSRITTITTDANGNAATRINDLPIGWYVLKEINPPNGYDAVITEPLYVCDNYTYNFQLSRTGSTKYGYYNIGNYAYTTVRWTKEFVGPYLPSQVTIILYQNGREFSRHTMKTTPTYYGYNGWWSGLPKFDSNGKQYVYTVREAGESNGELTLDGHKYQVGYVGNDIYNIERTNFTIKKEWDDQDNKYGLRPSSIRVSLQRPSMENEEMLTVDTVTLNESNNWTYTWTDLPGGNTNGDRYFYSAVEVDDGITSTIYTKDTRDSHKIINELNTVDIPVKKTWVGNNAKPSQVCVRLWDGDTEISSAIIQSDANNNWEHVFTGLPKFNKYGNEIDYTITEDAVGGYVPIYNKNIDPDWNTVSFEIVNVSQELISIPVRKEWVSTIPNAPIHPSSITAVLLSNGNPTGKTVSLSDSNNWRASFDALPKYDNITGSENIYSVIEVPVEQYAWEVDGDERNGFIITNTYGVTSVAVKKVWTNENNNTSRRPTSVLIHLIADGTDTGRTLTLTNSTWSGSFSNIPKYNAQGNEIVYTIKEDAVGFYTTSITGNQNIGFTVTNKFAENETSVKVAKAWNDKDNEANLRPASVVAVLKQQKHTNAQKLTTVANSTDVTKKRNINVADRTFKVRYTTTSGGYINIANWLHAQYQGPATFKTTNNNVYDYSATKNLLVADNSGVATINLNANNTSANVFRAHASGFTEEAYYYFDSNIFQDVSNQKIYFPLSRASNGLMYKKIDERHNGGSAVKYRYPDTLFIDSNNNGFLGFTFPVTQGQYRWNVNDTRLSTSSAYPTRFEKVVSSSAQWAGASGALSNIGFSGSNIASTTTTGLAAHRITIFEPVGGSSFYPTFGTASRPYCLSFYYTNSASTAQTVKVMHQTKTGYWNEGVQLTTFTAQPGTHYYTLRTGNAGTATGQCRLDFLSTSGANWNGNVIDLSMWDATSGVTTSDTGKTLTLDESNNWSGSFENLPRFDTATNAPIEYIVEEQPVENYTATIKNTGKAPNYATTGALTQNPYYSYNLTNTLGDIRDISVNKVWNDDDNKMKYRPESITVSLYADGVATGQTATLSQSNNWSATFANLIAKNSSGGYINYTVKEDRVARYDEPVISGTMDTGFTIANNLTLVNVPVNKVWNDLDDAYRKRPGSVTVHLYANGEDTGKKLVLSDTNAWMGTFNNLPAYTEANQEISYTVEEDDVNNYSKDITKQSDGSVVVENTLEKCSVPVNKVWNKLPTSTIPAELTVNLYRNGEVFDSIVLNEENGWAHTFDGLDVFDGEGNQYNYTVDEVAFDGFDRWVKIIAGNAIDGFTIINTENIDIPVYKVWSDSNDADQMRPGSVTVRLLADGKEIDNRILNAENEWESVFENLPRFNEETGKEIKYDLNEDIVFDYTTEIAGSAATGFTVENSHKVKYTSVTARKIWDDDDDQDKIRPASVTLNLMQNGVVFQSHEINADTGWEYTFSRLPIEDENGNAYIYAIEEADVPDGYESKITRNIDGIFIVTNSHAPSTMDIPVEKGWMASAPKEAIPESITVRLYQNEKEFDVAEIQPDENGIWKHVFEALPVSDADGNAYKYTISEDPVPDFHADIIGNAEDGFSIMNNYMLAETVVSIEKRWEGDEEANRPKSITVHLLRDDVKVDSKEVTPNVVDGRWVCDFVELPLYAPDGHEYQYSVEEEPVPGYLAEYGFTEGGQELLILNRKTLEIPVQKVWNDNNNANGSRPTSIIANLYAERYANAADLVYNPSIAAFPFSAVPSEGFDAEITFDGSVRTAIVSAISSDGQVISANTLNVNGIGTKIAFELGDIADKGTIIKVQDENGEDLGESVTSFMIFDDATYKYLAASKTLLEGNNWSCTFTGLKECDNRGFPMNYYVEEEAVFGYTGASVRQADGSFILENTEVDGIDVEKLWDTNDATDLPDKVVVNLLQNGKQYKSIELTAEGGWKGHFGGVAWRDPSGKEYVYTIEEEKVPGFEGRIVFDKYNYKATITNVPTTEIEVSKVWEGDEEYLEERPDSIKANLIRTVNETVPFGQTDNIEFWDNVMTDAYRQNTASYGMPSEISYDFMNTGSNEIYLRVDAILGNDIINTEYILLQPNLRAAGKFDIAALNNEKQLRWTFSSINEWDDALTDAIKNGEITGQMKLSYENEAGSVDVSAANEWVAKFEELPTKDIRNNIYAYRIVEPAVPDGYVSHVEQDENGNAVITNTYGKIDIPVEKIWIDMDDRDGLRPESIEVELYANDTPTNNVISLTSENGWKGSFRKLSPTDDEGNAIEYSVREVDVPEGYVEKVSGTAEEGFIIENSHDCKTSIKVTKVWDDASDYLKKRPTFITIHLFGDGEEVAVGKIQGTGDIWEMVFQNLPYVNSDGKVIEYTVTEESVDGYTQASLTGNGEDGYIITNWTPQPEYELPFSGMSTLALMTVFAGIILVILGTVKGHQMRRETKEWKAAQKKLNDKK